VVDRYVPGLICSWSELKQSYLWDDNELEQVYCLGWCGDDDDDDDDDEAKSSFHKLIVPLSWISFEGTNEFINEDLIG